MPFFRPASRALSHLLRHEPFHHTSSPASLFSRHSPFAPLTRAFDDSFFSSPLSAPLYTVYEVRDEDNQHNNNSNSNTNAKAVQQQQQPGKQDEPRAAESQQTQHQQQQQQNRSTDNRLARHENSHRQRWLDRRANHRHHRHSHHHSHHPLSLFSPFDSLLASPYFPHSSFQPPLDITLDLYSTPAAYQVNAAIPGVRKEDIKLTVDEGVLTIEAERREERGRPSTNAQPSAEPSASATSSTSAPAEASQAEQKTAEVEAKADTANTTDTTNNSTPAATTQTQPSQSTAGEEADDDVSVHHIESYYGRVQRSLTLPDDVNVDGLTARYEDGVLKIELPRVEEKRQQAKQINIQ